MAGLRNPESWGDRKVMLASMQEVIDRVNAQRSTSRNIRPKADKPLPVVDFAAEQEAAEDCPECGGFGSLHADCSACEGLGCDDESNLCKVCNGSGEQEDECALCEGTGKVTEDE